MDLPAAYVVLAKEAPALKLHVVTADNDVSLPMLVKGELDLVLNYLPHADSVSLTHVPVGALEHEHLYDDLVVVFASVKHRLAGQKRVTMADLVQERWAANQTLTALRQLSRAFQERGFAPPQIAFEARSAHLRLQAVAGSSLLGHLSRAIVQDPQGQTRISCNDFTA
jgi:DNA-binding transcriptional LysR family regulator